MFPQEPKDPLMGEGGGQRCLSLDRCIPAVLAVYQEEADSEPVRRVSWQGVSEETQDLRRRPQRQAVPSWPLQNLGSQSGSAIGGAESESHFLLEPQLPPL